MAVDVDRHDMTNNPCHWQGEPAISAAQVDGFGIRLDSDLLKHCGRIWPQSVPPSGGRHFSSFEETGKTTRHGRTGADGLTGRRHSIIHLNDLRWLGT